MSAKYDTLGKNYNATRRADPFIAETLFKLLQPTEKGVYLDIGCGTGNYTHALHKMGVKFMGIDPSLQMLEKAKDTKSQIEWRQGHAEKTGLENQSVNGIIGTLTMHHWNNLTTAFKELYRVLKPGGRIVLFTATPEQMQEYWLHHYFPKMLQDSIVQMPSLESVSQAMEQAGFLQLEQKPYYIQTTLQDLFLYSGKFNPSLYLNPEVRNGISSFSALANKKEVSKGLQKLQADIQSGKIEKVIQSSLNNKGDYLFLSASKRL